MKADKKLPSVNIVSKGSELKGNLTTASDLRIAGTLDGKAVSESKIIVASTGEVIGNIEAEEADIAGAIDGEVKVSSKLILRKSARVEGDIFTKTLLVEEGAQINGACNMGDSNAFSSENRVSAAKVDDNGAAKKTNGQKA